MSIFNFAPSPDQSTQERNYATWENGFSESELSDIRKIGDSLALEDSVTDISDQIDILRKSKTGWIVHNNDTAWLYNKLAYIARNLNGQFWDFDLFGFVEDFQYTVYTNSGDHYQWHMDKGMIENSPRKLSMVLQLSNPTEYQGGDLELQCGSQLHTAERKAGLIYAFPSWLLHRVTPVTGGTRKSLVVWIAGPKFK